MDTEKDNQSRSDEAKNKEKGEGLGKREPQNPDKPEVNNDLPEPEAPPTPTQLPS
jgi:hypothetical protein